MPGERSGQDDLGLILDVAPSILLGLDEDRRIAYANRRALQAFGYAREDLVGRPATELVPPEDVADDGWRSSLLQPDSGPIVWSRPTVARRRDGSTFAADAALVPLEQGAPWWCVVIIRDLTEKVRAEKQASQFGQAFRSLAALNAAIVRSRDEQTLYDQVCHVAVDEAGYLGAWVGRASGDQIVPVAVAGEVARFLDEARVSLDASDPRGRGPAARTLREGTAHFAADFAHDPSTAPWADLAGSFGIQSSGSMPLRRANEVVGVLTLYSRVNGWFDERTSRLLEQLAGNVSFALDSLATTEALAELARERAELAARLVDAQDEERARIAADVHDEPVQTLAAADLRLASLRRRLATEAPDLEPAVAEVQETVTAVVGGLRELLYELEPADLDAPLPQLVAEACAHVLDDTDVTWDVDTSGVRSTGEAGRLLPPASCRQALRIVKEALINVRKHAGPCTVHVAVRADDDEVTIEVADTGRGIGDVGASAARPGHRGLATMADRAAVVGGRVQVAPADPVGTRVLVRLPRPARAEHRTEHQTAHWYGERSGD